MSAAREPREGDKALTVLPVEWLDVIEQEYLAQYVLAGGAAVKVVSGTGAQLEQVRRSLQERAERTGYLFAALDPATLDAANRRPDLHRIDRFFFAATREVDWKARAADQARRHFLEQGVSIAPHRPLHDLEGIAEDNGRDAKDLLNEYQRTLTTEQLRDHGMALEFRTAVTALGRAQLLPDAVTPTTEEVLLAWFAGRSIPGAANALKKIHIFERINQTNARHILASFCRWLPKVGRSGLVAVLDFRPYEQKKITKTQQQKIDLARLREAIARGASQNELAELAADREPETKVYYSDAAYQQMLMQLRRFIDEIDWFERLLLVVLTGPGFYDAASPRNYFDYDALQTRIGLEVHDAHKANPAAALVHFG